MGNRLLALTAKRVNVLLQRLCCMLPRPIPSGLHVPTAPHAAVLPKRRVRMDSNFSMEGVLD